MAKKTRLQKKKNYKQKSRTRVKKTRVKRAGKKRVSRKLYGGAEVDYWPILYSLCESVVLKKIKKAVDGDKDNFFTLFKKYFEEKYTGKIFTRSAYGFESGYINTINVQLERERESPHETIAKSLQKEQRDLGSNIVTRTNKPDFSELTEEKITKAITYVLMSEINKVMMLLNEIPYTAAKPANISEHKLVNYYINILKKEKGKDAFKTFLEREFDFSLEGSGKDNDEFITLDLIIKNNPARFKPEPEKSPQSIREKITSLISHRPSKPEPDDKIKIYLKRPNPTSKECRDKPIWQCLQYRITEVIKKHYPEGEQYSPIDGEPFNV